MWCSMFTNSHGFLCNGKWAPQSNGIMTRDNLKGRCLIAKFEPRNVKDYLDSESCIEEIVQIEKNKT